MDKVIVNNQIVSMKKYVKQAKVHIINKLSKQVKILQKRKGSEDHVQKAKKKADRILELIPVLKKTNCDDVSRAALEVHKDWNAVLNQEDCSIELRSLAKLVNYPSVQTAVQSFLQKHEELVPKLPALLKQFEEKRKLIKTPKRLNNSQNILIDKKAINDIKLKEGLSNTQTKTDSNEIKQKQTEQFQLEVKAQNGGLNDNEKDDNHMLKQDRLSDNLVNSPKLNKVDDSTCSEKATICLASNILDKTMTIESATEDLQNVNILAKTMKVESSTEDLQNVNTSDIKDSDENTQSRIEIEENDKNSEDGASEKELSRSCFDSPKREKLNVQKGFKLSVDNPVKAIAVLSLDELQGLDEIPVGNESVEDDVAISSDGDNNDPFFLGNSVRLINVEDESNDKNVDKYIIKSKKDNNKSNRFKNYSGDKLDSPFDSKKRKFMSQDFASKKKFETKDKLNYNNSNIYKRNGTEDGNKGMSFKNKFEFSKNSNFNQKQDFNKFEKTEKFSKKGMQKPSKTDQSDIPLHPSWEAKRKQKELLKTPFQGKRMVFDD